MPNVFDQFDVAAEEPKAGENPFDQFDAAPESAPAPNRFDAFDPPAPEATTLGEYPGEVGRAASRLVQGAAQIPIGTLKFAGRLADTIRRHVPTGPELDLGGEQSALTTAGEWLERQVERLPGTEEQGLWPDVQRGIGQVGGALATGGGTKLLGGTKATTAAAGTVGMAGAEFEDAYSSAIQRGDDQDTAVAKALAYTGVAVTIENAAGVGRILRKFYPAKEQAARALTKWGVAKEVAKNVLAGYGEEASQRLSQDLIVQGKPDWEAINYEGTVGALVQGPVATATMTREFGPPSAPAEPPVTGPKPAVSEFGGDVSNAERGTGNIAPPGNAPVAFNPVNLAAGGNDVDALLAGNRLGMVIPQGQPVPSNLHGMGYGIIPTAQGQIVFDQERLTAPMIFAAQRAGKLAELLAGQLPPPSSQPGVEQTQPAASSEADLASASAAGAETEAQRLAREQREAMAAMRQGKELEAAVEQVRQGILARSKPQMAQIPQTAEAPAADSVVATTPEQRELARVRVGREHINAALDILEAEEAPPDVLDELQAVTRGIKPASMRQYVENFQPLSRTGRNKFGKANRIPELFRDDGISVDDALDGLHREGFAGKFETADDYAQALAAAYQGRIARAQAADDARRATEPSPAVQALAREIAETEARAAAGRNEATDATDATEGETPFSMAAKVVEIQRRDAKPVGEMRAPGADLTAGVESSAMKLRSRIAALVQTYALPNPETTGGFAPLKTSQGLTVNEALMSLRNALFRLKEAEEIRSGAHPKIKPEFREQFASNGEKMARADVVEAERVLKREAKKAGISKPTGGFDLLFKTTKTANGSRYYHFDYKGQWWYVRVADHLNRADRFGVDDNLLGRARTTSGMEFPHQLNIVQPEKPTSDAAALSLAKQAISEMPISLTARDAGHGWIDVDARGRELKYELPQELLESKTPNPADVPGSGRPGSESIKSSVASKDKTSYPQSPERPATMRSEAGATSPEPAGNVKPETPLSLGEGGEQPFSMGQPDFQLAGPETVAEQKARLKAEEARAKAETLKAEMLKRQQDRLTGTTGDLGQQDMFGGGELFSLATASRLDNLAGQVHGRSYADLETWQQDAIRAAVEAGTRGRMPQVSSTSAAGTDGRFQAVSAGDVVAGAARPLPSAPAQAQTGGAVGQLNSSANRQLALAQLQREIAYHDRVLINQDSWGLSAKAIANTKLDLANARRDFQEIYAIQMQFMDRLLANPVWQAQQRANEQAGRREPTAVQQQIAEQAEAGLPLSNRLKYWAAEGVKAREFWRGKVPDIAGRTAAALRAAGLWKPGEPLSLAPAQGTAEAATRERTAATQKIVDDYTAGAPVVVVAEGRALPGPLQVKFIRGWNRARAQQGLAPLTFEEATDLLNRIEGTVLPNGTVVLNAAAARMTEPGYVQAKLRHELAHVALMSAEGQARQEKLVGQLTQAQRAELTRLGYTNFLNLGPEAFNRWLANEFIARQAELNTVWWRRYVQHVRDWLAGRKGLKDITNEETARAILRALARKRPLLLTNGTVHGPDTFQFALRAHHGTPHEVDRFKLEKIGTGEGAQVYGWGLYFAENAEVANQYRRSTTGGHLRLDGKPLSSYNLAKKADEYLGWISAHANDGLFLTDAIREARTHFPTKERANFDAFIEQHKSRLAVERGGNEYTVDLDVTPEELMDWDKPLSEQSDKVKRYVNQLYRDKLTTRNAGGGLVDVMLYKNGGSIGAFTKDKLNDVLSDPADYIPLTGASLYQLLTRSGERYEGTTSARQASQALAKAGIRGIRYLDQGSRAINSGAYQLKPGDWRVSNTMFPDLQDKSFPTQEAAETAFQSRRTYNYVIFDESAIRITHKNGVPVDLDTAREEQAGVYDRQDATLAFSLGMPAQDTRRLTRQLDAATWLTPEQRASITNRIYDVANLPAAKAAAADLFQAVGLPAAQNLVLDTTVPIPGAVRAQLMQLVSRELARTDPQAFADFLNRAIVQTTDAGQFIAHLKGWMEATPEGAVATAQRLLEGVADNVMGSYRVLIAAARQALDQAHAAAKTETTESQPIQDTAKTAVDEAVEADPAVQAATRDQARGELGQDPGVRNGAVNALPKGADITDVLNSILEHFRFAGDAATTLKDKLVAAGVPERNAEAFAKSLEFTWKSKVEKIQKSIKVRLRTARLQREAAKASGKPEPQSASALDTLIREKLREFNVKLGEALRRPQMGRRLGDAIVADSGLAGAAAERLRERINARFETVATARKKAALDRLMRGQPNERKVKSLRAAFNKLLDVSNAGGLDDAKYFEAIKDALGLKRLTGAEAMRLRELAQGLQAIPEDQEQRRQEAAAKLMQAIGKLRPGHWWDFPMAIWYSHILSGPTTHVVNAGSNALNLAATLAAITLKNPGSLQVTIPQLARGVRQAIPEMLHALQTGSVTGARLGQKFNDPGVWDRVDSRWALPWKLVGRALAAEDLLFFYPAYQLQQGLLARAVARSEGLSGAGLRRRVNDILHNTAEARSAAAVQASGEGYTGAKHARRVEEIIQAQRDERAQMTETGREFALRTTFNNTPYGVLGGIAQQINGFSARVPAARLIVPFTNIIANVVNESLNYTPIGSGRALLTRFAGHRLYGKEADITSWADRETMAELHAKAALGTLLLAGLLMKALRHKDDDDPPFAITGQGPSDAGKRKTQLAAGWMPNSVKVGDRYYSYLNTPAAVPLAIIGNTLDALKWGNLDEASVLDRVAFAGAMSLLTMRQQSFLDSLARLTGAIEHPSPRNMGRNVADWAGRTGSSFVVPNAVRQIEQVFDPAKYDDYSVRGELLRHIPFARQNGKPSLNGLGEPVTRGWSERFTKPESADPVWRELARLNVGVYPTRLEWRETPLSDEQIYDVVRLSGPAIRRRVSRVMAGPRYAKYPENTQQDVLHRIITEQHAQAKAQVMR